MPKPYTPKRLVHYIPWRGQGMATSPVCWRGHWHGVGRRYPQAKNRTTVTLEVTCPRCLAAMVEDSLKDDDDRSRRWIMMSQPKLP